MGNLTKKKTLEVIQEDLLNSLKEREDEDQPGLDGIVKNAKVPEETIKIIYRKEKILNIQNKKIINIVGGQR